MLRIAFSYVFNQEYQEYLGIIYEDLIRAELYALSADNVIPFMPEEIGKWWGNVQIEGDWKESEADILAVNREYALIGECKYRTKRIGRKELDLLKLKANFIPAKGRNIIYLLASKDGFTEDVMKEEQVLFIQFDTPLNRIS